MKYQYTVRAYDGWAVNGAGVIRQEETRVVILAESEKEAIEIAKTLIQREDYTVIDILERV